MATYRFPVLIWEDFEGWFTARLVQDDYDYLHLAGVGPTAADALMQVKEYLTWSYEQYPWQPAPDFLDARLVHFKVDVRPEYHVKGQVYPCEETVSLRLACVHGRQESGLLVSALPILGFQFYYYEAKALRGLVTHYVREKLTGLTPQELSRYLPPKTVALDEIVLPVGRQAAKRRRPELPTLDAVAEPIGSGGLQKQFSRPYQREEELADLIQRLSKERANVLLVGETGIGKTALLVDAIGQIERQIQKTGKDDDEFSGYRHKFWLTSGARLIAGMQYLGQWEARCEAIIEELSRINGTLCVENLRDLVQTGGEPGSSVAAFFLPYLQRGELRLVAEATPTELDACRRLLPGFVDVFQILNLPAFSREKAVAVLDRVAAGLKRDLRVAVSEHVPDMVYRLFHRFAPYQVFPGRTVDFLTGLAERCRVERAGELSPQRVIEQFVRQTGLPELFLRDEIPLIHADVVEAFRKQVLGQESACRVAAHVVTTFKAGLNEPNRPVAVLLFCGPTGVGKTELAKALARFFFGHGEQTDRLVRLDMSEYAGAAAAQRLLGDPGGEPSEVIQKVRQQPFVVLLLDEIEKAAPEVFDVLLSVFDEGRLTDRYGRTTTFRSAVIIMTSNLGGDQWEAIGFDNRPAPSYEAEAMAFFRPEFYNRIDALVRFEPLGSEVIRAITEKELSEIAQREGLTRANIRLAWTDRLATHLAVAGFHPRYGARPLQRTIETRVVAPLAHYLIERPGLKDTAIRIDLDEKGNVVLNKQNRLR